MNPDQPVTPPTEPTPPPTPFEPAVPAPAPMPAAPVEPIPVAPAAPSPVEPAVVMPMAPTPPPPPPGMPVAPLAAPAMPSPGMPIVTSTEVPSGWNWGAFFFGWLWGVFNKVWISLLGLIPFVNVVMIFVLGAKGTQWAWEATEGTKTVEEFKATQHKWAVAGFIVFLGSLVLSVLGLVVLFFVAGVSGTQQLSVANNFMTDLKADNATAAYQLTSSAFQSTNSPTDFKTAVDAIAPAITTDPKVTKKLADTSNDSSQAIYDATFGTHTLELTLTKSSAGKWLVDNVTTP